jgi:hypothetical protein
MPMKTLMEDFSGMALTAPFPDAARMRRTDVFHDAEAAKRIIRRRPTQLQGQALEKLGRAVEYLMDSRMVLIDEPSTNADAEALEILMRLSRCVFSECEEIVPVSRRLKAWMLAKVQAH